MLRTEQGIRIGGWDVGVLCSGQGVGAGLSLMESLEATRNKKVNHAEEQPLPRAGKCSVYFRRGEKAVRLRLKE